MERNHKKEESGSIWKSAGILAIGAVIGAGIYSFFSNKNTNEEKEYSVSSTKTSNKIDYTTDDTTPESFLCPISQEIMSDPVSTPYGNSFDRKSIEDWLNKKNTCPLSRKPLSQKDLIPNYSLKQSIEWYVSDRKKKTTDHKA